MNYQSIETALCIWEWILEQENKSKAVAKWRDAVGGSAALRMHCVDLAVTITEEEDRIGALGWNDPFDWEIIPSILSKYLAIIKQDSHLYRPSELKRLVNEAWEADQQS